MSLDLNADHRFPNGSSRRILDLNLIFERKFTLVSRQRFRFRDFLGPESLTICHGNLGAGTYLAS